MTRLRRALIALVLLAVLVLSACGGGEEGSGEEGAESRELDTFSRVRLDGAADVVITVGAQQAVTVRGDDNLLGDVRTEVDDDTLEISQNEEFEPKVGITIEIAVSELEEFELIGAGDVDVTGVRGEEFRVDVTGAGSVEANGAVDRVEVEISGAGDVRLAALVAREADVEISGAGDVEVQATESLDASISGAGEIRYTGDPRNVDTDVTGAGEIRPG